MRVNACRCVYKRVDARVRTGSANNVLKRRHYVLRKSKKEPAHPGSRPPAHPGSGLYYIRNRTGYPSRWKKTGNSFAQSIPHDLLRESEKMLKFKIMSFLTPPWKTSIKPMGNHCFCMVENMKNADTEWRFLGDYQKRLHFEFKHFFLFSWFPKRMFSGFPFSKIFFIFPGKVEKCLNLKCSLF